MPRHDRFEAGRDRLTPRTGDDTEEKAKMPLEGLGEMGRGSVRGLRPHGRSATRLGR